MSRSGDATLISGDHGFNEYAAATDPVVRGRVTGDAFDRVIVQAGGTILTGNGTIAPTAGSIDGSLLAANNLSDVASAATSRTNLGLGTAATLASTAVALVANNLSDLANAGTARTNLGLGTAATQASTVFAQVANNLSDVTAATARTNLNAASLAANSFTASQTLADAANLIVGSTTGTQIATTTTQKIAFFGATPVVQPAGSADLGASLAALGLVGAITNPPLNLGTGALTAGTTSVGALTATSVAATGTVALTGTLTVTDAINVVLGSTTGTKIGTATTQKLAFYNATPVVQPAGSADLGASLAALGLVGAITNPPLNLGTGAVTAGTASINTNITMGSNAGSSIVLTENSAAAFNRDVQFQTAGVLRWVLRVNSTAEGGSNAGSDLQLLSRTDAGAAIATVFTITRSSSLVTWADTVNFAVGTTTGTKIGTATNQKLGFFNATPVVQAAAITAPVATAATNVTPFGYATAAQADAIRAAVISLLNLVGTASGGLGFTA